MNTNHREPSRAELDEARLTAYALDQLNDAERAAFEAQIAELDPHDADRLRLSVDEIRTLARHVSEAAHRDALPQRSPALRALVEQRLSQPEDFPMSTPKTPSPATSRPWYRRRWLALAAAACLMIAAIPIALVMVDRVAHDRATEIAMHEHDKLKNQTGPSERAQPQKYEKMVMADAAALPASETPEDEAGKERHGYWAALGGGGPMDYRSAASTPSPPAMPGGGAAPEGEKTQPTVDHYAAGLPEAGMPGPGIGPGGSSAPARATPYGTTADAGRGGYGGMPGMMGSEGMMGTGMEGMGMGPGMGMPGAEAARPNYGAYEGRTGRSMFSAGVKSEAGLLGEVVLDGESAPKESARPMAESADMYGGGAPAGMGGMYEAGGEVHGKPPSAGEPAAMLGGRVLPRDYSVTDGNSSTAPTESLALDNLRTETRRRGQVAVMTADGRHTWRIDESQIGNGDHFVDGVDRRHQVYGRPVYDAPTPTAPGTEQYETVVENKFFPVASQPLSTFSIDVDTASYTNVRRFLSEGRLPPPSAVRIEEMVNYFRYDYAPPDDETPFSVDTEVAQCPWRAENRLLRIGLKGREIERDQRGPTNLVFLLDVSGSMRDENKLPLVKRAMRLLVDELNEDDRVAIVTYASNAGLKLESTCAADEAKIVAAIDALSAGGSTHGSAGIQMAYEEAGRHFVEGGANRVILATDGDLNVGITDDDALVKLIRKKAKSGVFLTVLGFGTGNLKDAKMEKLADHGNGVYAYIDSLREAQKVLVEQISASLVTIAKDVKIQIEFNPAEVAAYRLLGYENRVMAAQDFDDDKKDAGEIGAGHTVTALYELVPAGEPSAEVGAGEMLKYQRVPPRQPPAELTDAAQSGELFTLRLRYKEPDGKRSELLEFVAEDSGKRFGEASPDFQFAASVVSFGLVLRHSRYMGDLTLAAVEEFAVSGLGDDAGGYRAEFVDLVQKARKLSGQ